MMPKKRVAIVFYIVFAAFYTAAMIYNFVFCTFYGNDVFESFKRKSQLLTVWNSVLQSGYYILSAVNAVQGLHSKNNTALSGLCNRIYVSLMFPIGMMVCILFWSVWSIDRELVFPRVYDKIIPSWQNHAMHSLPFFTTLADAYLVHHPYPKFTDGVQLTILFASSYLGLTLYMSNVYGIWLYPILKVMDSFSRFILFTSLFAATFLVYKAGQSLNAVIWRHKFQKIK